MTRKIRRKKGDDENDNGAVGDVDHLPEDHTVADSIATSLDFEEDASIDDLLSTGGGGSYCESLMDQSQARHTKAVDSLGEIQDLLTEKRSTKREAGLRRFFRAITQYSQSETLVPFRDEMIQLAMSCLRGGSPAEQYAACRCLEAQAVVLGADQDEYYEEIEPNLKRVVLLTSRATMVRAAALRALCVTNFVCTTDDCGETTNSLLDLTEAVAQPEYRTQVVPATLRATALECWCLLSTTLFDEAVSGHINRDDDNEDDDKEGHESRDGRGLLLLPLIQSCLDDSSVDLRTAAGQCMALIHESRLALGVVVHAATTTITTTERKFQRGGWEGSPQELIVLEIQERMTALSNQSGHSISKKVKKEIRSTFREYVNTVVDDDSPEESVSFRGGSQLTITSWKGIVQLSFIRHCLQGGFQIQLLTNPTLQTIFGTDGIILNGSGGTMSQLEKRLYLSKTSEAAKSAHVDMTKKRRTRSNVKNHFLTTDGEDI